MNFDLIRTSSLNNTFKNTGIFTTSMTLSGNIGAGDFGNFDSTITLPATPNYSNTVVELREFSSGTTSWWDVGVRGIANVTVGPVATIDYWINTIINGNSVTFRAQVFNPNASSVTLQDTTVNVQYVTYTLAR